MKSKGRKVAEWCVHNSVPKVYGRVKGLCRWRIELWAIIQHDEVYENATTELETANAYSLSRLCGLAHQHLLELVAGRTVVNAGFKVYSLPRKRK